MSTGTGTRGRILRHGILLVLVVVLANLLGQRFGFRLDLTGDGRYTLDPATTQLLDELDEAVTVTAYFTEDLPPDLALVRQEFKDLLVEYQRRSGGRLGFAFIDPNQADQLEQEALEAGVRPLQVSTRAKDKVDMLRAYMGAVVTLGEEQVMIPVIDARAMEWSMSSAIKELLAVDKPVLGVVIGHGESHMNTFPQALQSLNAQFQVQHYTFWDTMAVHSRFNTLLLVDPTDSIPAMHLHRLDEFLRSGRNVVIAYSAVKGNLDRSPEIGARRTGLEDLLAAYGIIIEPRAVIDAQCMDVQVLQQRGGYSVPVALPFPWFPRITRFGTHPVTGGLDMLELRFASPIRYVGGPELDHTPLLLSSSKSNSVQLPETIDLRREWSDADFGRDGLVMGAAWEGDFGDGNVARLVVFTNGNFAVNGVRENAVELPAANVNLLVNAVDWAANATGLIELRSKGPRFRPIDELSDARRSLLKWTNLLLPMLLLLAFGLFRARWRAAQRRERQRTGYVR